MEMKPVEGSSTIHSVGYNVNTYRLRIQFKDKNGTISQLYEYDNVDEKTHAALMAAPSMGSFLQTVIKREPARFPATRIEEESPLEIDAGEVGQQIDRGKLEVVWFDLVGHIKRQSEWSERTFGPGERSQGVVDHIRKELEEVEAAPDDLSEWVDVIILGLDGAWRAGFSPEEIAAAIDAKQTRNEGRTWPDWRTADPTKAIEHVRS